MTPEIILIVLAIAILIYSVIIHEISHGAAALLLGDPTAKYADRLTLNPKSHIDLFGSIIVPIVMFFSFQFAFGWAKPVPYNPFNLSNQKWGPLLVALAGPASNIVIAFCFAILAGLMPLSFGEKRDILVALYQFDWETMAYAISGSIVAIIFALSIIIVFWNVVLAFFNLIPIPPLDGSKILYTFFPISMRTQMMLEQFGIFLLIGVLFLFGGVVSSVISFGMSIFMSLVI